MAQIFKYKKWNKQKIIEEHMSKLKKNLWMGKHDTKLKSYKGKIATWKKM